MVPYEDAPMPFTNGVNCTMTNSFVSSHNMTLYRHINGDLNMVTTCELWKVRHYHSTPGKSISVCERVEIEYKSRRTRDPN